MTNQIKIIKLKVIKNSKGDILKYINFKDKYLKKFGETYFTEIKKNVIKGWNCHKKNTCLITVPYGKVKFTFAKNILKKHKTVILDRKNYRMIIVPPKMWFKFTSMKNISLIVNTLNSIHSDLESLKLPINDKDQ